MVSTPSTQPSFVDRLVDPDKMGVRAQGNVSVVIPTSVLGEAFYRSPYQLHFQFRWQDLTVGFDRPPYNNPADEQAPGGSRDWGPEQREYPKTEVPAQFMDHAARWCAERLVAVAASMIGYNYRHHHIPDWAPSDGKGLDCSNFTRFIYNYALGLQLNSQTDLQANPLDPNHPFYTAVGNRQPFRPQKVADVNDEYNTLCSKLRTGDLLFIAGNHSKADIRTKIRSDQEQAHTIINHVMMWLGDVGYAGSNTPLIIDSHGGGLTDSKGNTVPVGIWVRPFHPSTTPPTISAPEGAQSQGWYYDHFAWALRYF